MHVADTPCEVAAEVDIVPGEAGDGPEFWTWESGEGVEGEVVEGAEEEVEYGLYWVRPGNLLT